MTVAAHRKLPQATRAKLESILAKRFRALKVSRPQQLIQIATATRSPIKRKSEAIYLIGILSDLDKLGGQDQTIVHILSKLMKEGVPLVAWASAVTIAQIGNCSVVYKLTNIANTNEAEEARRAAIYALGRLGDPRATPLLVRVLENQKEAPELRAEAAEALATCGYNSKPAIAALTRALGARSIQVKFFSAYALGICARMGGLVGEQAIRRLQGLLRNSSVLPQLGSLSKGAANSLRNIESGLVAD